MLYYCGLRRCELLNLNWDDIGMGKDLIYLRSSKNKKGRIIPIHQKVKEFLELYLDQRLPMDDRALILYS
jgi:integrase